MAITQITTHVADALDRLLAQYQNQPNIRAMVTALASHVQKIEDAIFALIDGRMLVNAVGAQLDGIGEIVGLKRNGLGDSQYRTLLYGKIAENTSDGTLNSLIAIAQQVFEASQVFCETPNSPTQARRTAPAHVQFSIGGATIPSNLLPLVESIVQASTSAGVMLTFLSSHQAAGTFAFAGPQPWVQGFGDVNNPAVGAPFATLLYQNPSS